MYFGFLISVLTTTIDLNHIKYFLLASFIVVIIGALDDYREISVRHRFFFQITAAVIVAGLDWIERKLDPGLPHNINHYRYTEEALKEMGIGILPQNLIEAINSLKKDDLFFDQLGKDFLNEYIQLKEMEWTEYQRHVSDWEVNRYLEFF